MIQFWYVGFYRPDFRPRMWFGHCEVWGFTEDQTWLFLDPVAEGLLVRVEHRHDAVMAHLEARFDACDEILKLPASDPQMRFPVRGLFSCASLVGSLMGERALFPGTLRRKLLRKGAEVIHESKVRKRVGQGSASA